MSSKAVLIRSGGLGDFVLTVPLLSVLCATFPEVVLVTRPRFFSLIDDLGFSVKLVDADFFEAGKSPFLSGAKVFTFWTDDEFLSSLLESGAEEVRPLISRPDEPPHIVERMFRDSKLTPPENFPKIPWLRTESSLGRDLWVHPGSGSSSKNVPLEAFVELAEDWLSQSPDARVVFSFGEADEEVEDEFYVSTLAENERVELVEPVSNADFVELLRERAVRFIGNDSGPAHLAACLGIPTQVFFKTTDPEIWRPLGPGVEILQPPSESS